MCLLATLQQGPSLIDYKEYHTDVSVRFQLELTPEKMAEWEAAGIESKLKLTSKFATSECSLAVLIADPVSARRRCWLGIGGSDMLLSRSGCDVQHQRNMMLFDKDGLIKHYATPEQVLEEFYELRLHYYELRRQALLKVRGVYGGV
eukprot:scaffold181272_cov17-Tisochrysis_lutea.AAC.1